MQFSKINRNIFSFLWKFQLHHCSLWSFCFKFLFFVENFTQGWSFCQAIVSFYCFSFHCYSFNLTKFTIVMVSTCSQVFKATESRESITIQFHLWHLLLKIEEKWSWFWLLLWASQFYFLKFLLAELLQIVNTINFILWIFYYQKLCFSFINWSIGYWM